MTVKVTKILNCKLRKMLTCYIIILDWYLVLFLDSTLCVGSATGLMRSVLVRFNIVTFRCRPKRPVWMVRVRWSDPGSITVRKWFNPESTHLQNVGRTIHAVYFGLQHFFKCELLIRATSHKLRQRTELRRQLQKYNVFSIFVPATKRTR